MLRPRVQNLAYHSVVFHANRSRIYLHITRNWCSSMKYTILRFAYLILGLVDYHSNSDAGCRRCQCHRGYCSCFAHVRPCAQGRCGRCPPGSGVISDLLVLFSRLSNHTYMHACNGWLLGRCDLCTVAIMTCVSLAVPIPCHTHIHTQTCPIHTYKQQSRVAGSTVETGLKNLHILAFGGLLH